MAGQRWTLLWTFCLQVSVGLMSPLLASNKSVDITPSGHVGQTGAGDFLTTNTDPLTSRSCPLNCTCSAKNHVGNYTLLNCYRNLYASFPRSLSELWHSLEIVSMPYNRLTYLDPDMMPDLPNLTALHLQNNEIVSIAEGTFDKYPKLLRLELASNFFAVDNNHTSLINLLCGLSHTSITHLYLHRITHDQDISIKQSTFKCLEKTNLTYLDFSYNHVIQFPDGLFSPIRNIEYLDLRKTVQALRINAKAFRKLNHLSTLLLQLNPIQHFPKFLDDDNSTILPNLRKLCLDFGIFPRITADRFEGLGSLQILTLDWNNFGLKDLYQNNFMHMHNLKMLSLGHNTFENIADGALDHPTLELLDLTGSTFSVNPIPEDLLLNLPNLKTLRFSEIYSLYGGTKSLVMFLRNLTNLENIQLRNLNLARAEPRLFHNNKKLQSINLSNNQLRIIHPNLFAHLNLTELYLSNNRILSITQSTFPPSLLRSLSILDLSYNPFDCSCNSIYWFREQWMAQEWNNKKMKSKLHLDKAAINYACSTPEKFQGQFLDSISLKEDCLNSPVSLGFILVLTISFFTSLIFLVLSLMYRYQWHFRYWCFNLKAKWKEQHPTHETDNTNYLYDAFVSYCSSDIKWVKMNLLTFERAKGLSFCLHERDWLAGQDIVDNIIESIQQSRKIILVVSNAFARSQWCYFEMTMIQVEILKQDKDNVILIIKEEVDDVNMNPRLAWHLSTKTYIEWPFAKGNCQSLISSGRFEASVGDRVTHNSRELDTLIGQHLPKIPSLALPGNNKAEKLFWEKLEKAVLKRPASIRTSAV